MSPSSNATLLWANLWHRSGSGLLAILTVLTSGSRELLALVAGSNKRQQISQHHLRIGQIAQHVTRQFFNCFHSLLFMGWIIFLTFKDSKCLVARPVPVINVSLLNHASWVSHHTAITIISSNSHYVTIFVFISAFIEKEGDTKYTIGTRKPCGNTDFW